MEEYCEIHRTEHTAVAQKARIGNSCVSIGKKKRPLHLRLSQFNSQSSRGESLVVFTGVMQLVRGPSRDASGTLRY